jgi:hypothetical protein
VTSSPRRSTGVETDDSTQPPAVHDELDADPAESLPAAQSSAAVTEDAADPDAETAVREAVTSADADDDRGDVAAEVDEGPSTNPHGLPPVDAGADTDLTSGGDLSPAPPLVPPPAPEEPRRVRPAVRRTGKVRKARLRLLRVEPWSVMKSAFVLSIAIGITLVVAAATLWSVIDAAGVFEVVGTLITDLTESESSAGIEVQDYVGFSRVVGLATVIAVVDVVLLTALATLFAFLYNLSAALLGGFEVTLAEDD